MRFTLFYDKIISRSSTICMATNDQRLWPDNLRCSRCPLIWNDKRLSTSDCHQSGINFNFNFCVFSPFYLQAIEMSQRLIKAPAAAWEDLLDISPILPRYFSLAGPDFEPAN